METGGIFNGYGRKSERSLGVLSLDELVFPPSAGLVGYLNIERASRGNKVDDESTRWPVASGSINVTRKIPKRNRARERLVELLRRVAARLAYQTASLSACPSSSSSSSLSRNA